MSPMSTREQMLFWLESVRQDVSHAVRRLRLNPISSAAVILSFALGIGLNAGVYSILDWVLLRTLPYPSPHQLVRVFTAATAPATGPRALTSDEFSRLRQAESFTSVAAFSTATRVITS